jgi:hypothetical protein
MAGGFIATGKGITLYRLMAARSVMRLASQGVMMHNTKLWAKQMRLELNLRPRAPYRAIMKAITLELERISPEVLAQGGIKEL